MEHIPQKPQKTEQSTTQESHIGINLEITKRFLDIDNEQDLIDRVEASIEAFKNGSQDVKLGSGYNAEVFSIQSEDGKFSELCVKKIKKNPEVIINDIEEEAEFQSKVAAAGVRTPLYVMAVRDKQTLQRYIIMEHIKGVSLAKGNILPDTFEHKKFFTELRGMVKRMHEAKIHHRDLHEGNIMVTEQGDPVIIDFGAATYDYGFGGDEDLIYRADGRRFNHATGMYISFYQEKLPRDMGKLDFLEKEMRPEM
ncbi:MAG: phosphotransferase [Candidatus Pacebacteria bacterium]|nr:phosphotransferase [Candidatus Paceibacterota bacterium]MCD8507844.1 phosphotransferase [Candidatus Paceibacterota bacterium]MCD8527817.1 phosphotransferase [Candidatus Paceibacterota bacterium]MCD8563523.1 phosphotransferase [Candidatus Paceibacterota bacterium]